MPISAEKPRDLPARPSGVTSRRTLKLASMRVALSHKSLPPYASTAFGTVIDNFASDTGVVGKAWLPAGPMSWSPVSAGAG